jgi:hypothetical protein
MRAWLNLRYTVPERLRAFVSGIERLGYRAEIGLPDRIGERDCFITWGRINAGNTVAQRFQDRCLPVIVAENAAWGNDFLGRRWYSLAMYYHNTAARFPVGGNERWDSLGVDLAPFRESGETVILPQRGIGSPPTRMPSGWPQDALRRYGGRIRPHPGTKVCKPLEQDLAHAGRTVTWGSGSAVKALMWGIPVVSEMPHWVAEQDNTPEGRIEMFRRLAWAQWQIKEIESGEAFAHVLLR